MHTTLVRSKSIKHHQFLHLHSPPRTARVSTSYSLTNTKVKRRTTKRDQQRPGRRDHQGARKEGSPRGQGGGTTKEPGKRVPGKRDHQAREEEPPSQEEEPPSQGGGTKPPRSQGRGTTKEPGKRDYQEAGEVGPPRSQERWTKGPGRRDHQGARKEDQGGRRDHQGAREEGPRSQGGGTTKDGQEEVPEE
ncbi:hypothetical protein BDR07DRAFT_605843 [Suillus spraguei]|nr:hypothetical protein BDR07DRAFT_605843 [Suillus spraguei]